jgi:ribokinase
MSKHCVVGSLNMDMVTRVERFALPGETISGTSFAIFPGGKGGNQAVALARLGATVEMVGALGDDALGARYAQVLDEAGIGRAGVSIEGGCSTGTAAIEVTSAGENRIIVVPGANGRVFPSRVESARAIIESGSTLLLQLEIPLESILAAARIAGEKGLTVILDPAPARELPDELYSMVSVVTPNETEAGALTGEDTRTEEGIERAARGLLERGAGAVIVKAGARGAYLARGATFSRVRGFRVRPVDTVAAGDSFNAALALALSEGRDLPEAMVFANAVAALSTTREGAQGAMPDRADAERFMSEAPRN